MSAQQNDDTPVVAQDALEPAILSDADTRLLTEARTASWKLQQYEYAYDVAVHSLAWRQTLVEFLGVVVAVIFVFMQIAVPDSKVDVEHVLGIAGTGMSLLVILATIWASMAQWKTRIEKMQKLSTEARQLLKSYEMVIPLRPVDHPKIRSWMISALDYEERRKEPLAKVSTIAMKRGFQHVGKQHAGRGVVCGACNREWNYESNRRARWTWLPFYGCSECGV